MTDVVVCCICLRETQASVTTFAERTISDSAIQTRTTLTRIAGTKQALHDT